MLDYSALSAVGAVVREGSFERAALALKITPSAVSQRIRGLEERIGAVLIVRGQPCRPTDLGRALCAHLDRVRLLEGDLTPLMETGRAGAAPPPALKVAVNADSLATWFPAAAARFGRDADVLMDLTLDDEAHTAERLRSGEVLAVVTADPEPVQGCRTVALGGLRYAACCSPDFLSRFFADGVGTDSLAAAPYLRFDRRDGLQARWAAKAHGCDLAGRAHRIPSTQAFLDLAVAGLGWGMQPVDLAQPALAAGTLVELPPCLRLDVDLYWTVSRLPVAALNRLTEAVRGAANGRLIQTVRAPRASRSVGDDAD